MTIAFGAAGTVGVGTGGANTGLGMPSGVADGNGVLLVVVTKPETATPVTPTDWTLVGTASGGAGTTGVDTGPTKVAVFFREKTSGWSTVPTVTVTGGNSSASMLFSYTKTTGTWGVTAATGVYNGTTAATSVSQALGSVLDLTAGEWFVGALSNHTDSGAWTGQSVTATGVSAWGTATLRTDAIESSSGNDIGGILFDRPVTTGTATAAPTVSATSTTAATGGIVGIRLREVSAGSPPTGTATGTFTYTGTAVGDAPALDAADGTATGTWTFTGAAVGDAPTTYSEWTPPVSGSTESNTRTGTATGDITWTGTAAGTAPTPGVSDGVATGLWNFIGTAVGRRNPKGTGAGFWAHLGAVTGYTPPVDPSETPVITAVRILPPAITVRSEGMTVTHVLYADDPDAVKDVELTRDPDRAALDLADFVVTATGIEGVIELVAPTWLAAEADNKRTLRISLLGAAKGNNRLRLHIDGQPDLYLGTVPLA